MMSSDGTILVDTSAWVEYLRGTGSAVHLELQRLVGEGQALGTTDVVIMELLAGGRGETRARELRRFILGFVHLPVRGLADFEAAAALYRECRRGGYTPRSLDDCLIAAVAIRAECRVLHHDRDFDGIARCTALKVVQP